MSEVTDAEYDASLRMTVLLSSSGRAGRMTYYGQKVFDHKGYCAKVQAMSDESLVEVIRQCEFVAAEWDRHPNRHYYLTEIAYCRGEQANRATEAAAACGQMLNWGVE